MTRPIWSVSLRTSPRRSKRLWPAQSPFELRLSRKRLDPARLNAGAHDLSPDRPVLSLLNVYPDPFFHPCEPRFPVPSPRHSAIPLPPRSAASLLQKPLKTPVKPLPTSNRKKISPFPPPRERGHSCPPGARSDSDKPKPHPLSTGRPHPVAAEVTRRKTLPTPQKARFANSAAPCL